MATNTTITTEQVQDLLKGVLGTVAFYYDNIIKNGKDTLLDYLKNSKMTEKEKGDVLSSFMANVVNQSVGNAIMLAGEIAKANAELELKLFDKDKVQAEVAILQEQLKQEQYKTTTIMPKEALILDEEKILKSEQSQTEDKRQQQIDAEILKLGAEKLLVDAQTAVEGKKAEINGLIDQQTELYRQQGLSFKGHNLSKGADSIAQIVGMIVAEGSVPDTGIISAHAKCVQDLASLSGTTITSYTTVK